MPNYTNVLELLRTLPMVGSVTTIMSSDMCGFIGDAETFVDAKISTGYTVPVAGSPPILRLLSTDIALYRLLTRRVFTQEQINKSDWPDRYKEALETLDQIAEGEIPLLTSSGAQIDGVTTGSGVPTSNTMNLIPTMNERPVESQQVDPEKLA